MAAEEPAQSEGPKSFSVGKTARLTGLSVELLRAWERRYGAVEPMRTAGGTRRYRPSDIERLKLLRSVVESGNRIGDVAQLHADALRAYLPAARPELGETFERTLEAIRALDSFEVRRLLSAEMSALGPVEFAKTCFLPLAREVGNQWETGSVSIAAEHLMTTVLRSLLTISMESSEPMPEGPRIVFATPSGEPHDLGLMAAAVVAMGAGAVPVVLGADVPSDEVVESARHVRAEAVAIAVVTLAGHQASEWLTRLRARLPASTALWIGGAGARRLPPIGATRVVPDFASVEASVAEIL